MLPGEPEDIFRRALRDRAFDVSELSMGSHIVTTARGDSPYVGVPVFPSRAFRHSAVYIRTDRGIAGPGDLAARTVGAARVPADRGALGARHPARALRRGHARHRVADGRRAGGDQPAGGLRRAAARRGSAGGAGGGPPGRADRAASAGRLRGRAARRSGGSGPTTAPRRSRGTAPPASSRSCTASPCGGTWRSGIPGCRWSCSAPLPARGRWRWPSCGMVNVLRVSLPWAAAAFEEQAAIMGGDPWPYGFARNRDEIAAMIRFAVADGLAAEPIPPEALFHPSTLAEALTPGSRRCRCGRGPRHRLGGPEAGVTAPQPARRRRRSGRHEQRDAEQRWARLRHSSSGGAEPEPRVAAPQPGHQRQGSEHHPELPDHLPGEEVEAAEGEQQEHHAVQHQPRDAAERHGEDQAAPLQRRVDREVRRLARAGRRPPRRAPAPAAPAGPRAAAPASTAAPAQPRPRRRCTMSRSTSARPDHQHAGGRHEAGRDRDQAGAAVRHADRADIADQPVGRGDAEAEGRGGTGSLRCGGRSIGVMRGLPRRRR